MSVQGPLAREVRDVRLGLAAMSARDPRDPWWVPAPLKGPALEADQGRPRAGCRPTWPPTAGCSPWCAAPPACLSDAGYRVEEVEVPDLTAVWQLWIDILLQKSEILQEQQMNAVTGDEFKRDAARLQGDRESLDAAGYMSAIATAPATCATWLLFLEQCPLVLTPVSVRPTPAPRADLGGDAQVREMFRNDLRFISAINVLGLPAAVVPAGLLRGHPVGVQLIASRYREDLCLDAARSIERRVGVLAHQLWARAGRGVV